MLKKLLLVFCTALASTANVAYAAINYQDMWWNANESGWGVNVAQQNNTMFATWFIYAAGGQPLWVVMSNAQRSGANGNTFTGDLFQTTGTAFSVVPFTPLQPSNVTTVGSATFVFSDAKNGTLTYSINGAQVVKQITRQPLSSINLSGTYYGGIFRTANCANSGVSNSIYSVTHTPSSPLTGTISVSEVGGNLCRFTGTLNQSGSVFDGSGTYSCQGEAGSWTGTEGTGGETTFAIKLALQTGAGVCTTTLGGFKSP
ncbi:MAG: hypothetical protein ABI905_15105 [Betaproteobacteria bacterium]